MECIKLDRKLNTKRDQNKASALTIGGHGAGNHSDMDLICIKDEEEISQSCLTPKRTEYGKQIRKQYESGEIKEQRKNIQQLEPREDGKTNCLTTVQKDNMVMEEAVRQPSRLNCRIRRLTPHECAKLQTIPDWYEWKGKFPDGSVKATSDTQIYKMCGNGWCVEVIKHIFSFINLKQVYENKRNIT